MAPRSHQAVGRLSGAPQQARTPTRPNRGFLSMRSKKIERAPRNKVPQTRTRTPAPSARCTRPRQPDPMEICVQPELDFERAHDDCARPQTALVPVASIAERRRAGLLDGLFIGLTGSGFVALFHFLGGEITFAKTDAVVYAAVAYLFYAQYFFLFTTLAGATPGMQLAGLTVVGLDGSLPDTRQLLWRSFGYICSPALLTLFLRAFFGRSGTRTVSLGKTASLQTYVTAATPIPSPRIARNQQGIHEVRRAILQPPGSHEFGATLLFIGDCITQPLATSLSNHCNRNGLNVAAKTPRECAPSMPSNKPKLWTNRARV